MKINLITGATGFIGNELARQIEAAGEKVFAMSRKRQEGPWFKFLEQDFSEELDIPDHLLEKVDCVYHLAGIAHAESNEFVWSDYYQVNVKATEQLAELAGGAGVKKFIFVSSIKASGDPENECVDEKWKLEPNDDYGKSKWLAEQAVVRISKKYNMDYVIVRPTLVYGPRIKGNLLKMIEAIDKRRFPPIPEVKNKRSLVHVVDLCRALMLVASDKKAVGKTYIVSDLKQYSTRHIYEIIMQSLDRPLSKLYVPLVCFNGAAKVGDLVEKMLGRKIPMNSIAINKLFGSACYNASKIQRELEFEPIWTLGRAMPQIIESYRNFRTVDNV